MKKYESKFEDPEIFIFRCEAEDKSVFCGYVEKNKYNFSAVARMMLKQFLEKVNK